MELSRKDKSARALRHPTREPDFEPDSMRATLSRTLACALADLESAKNKLESAKTEAKEQNRRITCLEKTASSSSATVKRLADELASAGQELSEISRALVDVSHAQGKQAERAGHYFKRSWAAGTLNSRLRKTKANLEEETKAAHSSFLERLNFPSMSGSWQVVKTGY